MCPSTLPHPDPLPEGEGAEGGLLVLRPFGKLRVQPVELVETGGGIISYMILFGLRGT